MGSVFWEAPLPNVFWLGEFPIDFPLGRTPWFGKAPETWASPSYIPTGAFFTKLGLLNLIWGSELLARHWGLFHMDTQTLGGQNIWGV